MKFALALLFLSAFGLAGGPEPAEKLLKDAQKRATVEKKAVFVIFDASW